MRKTILLALGCLSLTGCYSIQGSERVINRDGLIADIVPKDAVFRADFKRAYDVRFTGGKVPQDKINAMLSSGLTHIESYCDNYFDVMGAQQRKSQIARDSIAPVSAIITGVISLQSFGEDSSTEKDLLAALGIATAATSSVLNIYDRHMLFGAENVGSVETLTENALATHKAAVLSKTNVSYDAAISHLMDNQDICSPQHIILRVREAIKQGQLKAIDRDTNKKANSSNNNSRVRVEVDNNN